MSGPVTVDFSGQISVRTGVGRSIAREPARSMADVVGAAVYVPGFDKDAAATTGAEIGAQTFAEDVSSADPLNDAQIVLEAGRIDVVTGSADTLRDSLNWKMADDDWDAVHAVCTFKMTGAANPTMRAHGAGRISNATTHAALPGKIGQANYSSVRAGIVGCTRTAARELARFGITVNAVTSNAATDMIASVSPEKPAELTAVISAGHFGGPSEMAAAVCSLASAESAYSNWCRPARRRGVTI